jgi:hypothetical protein
VGQPPGLADADAPKALTLSTVGRYATTLRQKLEAQAIPLADVVAATLDKLGEVADLCRKKEDYFNEINAHRTRGGIGVKMIELVQGKKMTVDVNVRSQEDLIPWDQLSPDLQKRLGDAMDDAQRELGPKALRSGR